MRDRRHSQFAGALALHLVVVVCASGFSSSCERVAAAERPEVSPIPTVAPEVLPLAPLGDFRMTYYYVAHEDQHAAPDLGSESLANEVSELTDAIPPDGGAADAPNAAEAPAAPQADATAKVEVAEASAGPDVPRKPRPTLVTLFHHKTCEPLATVNRNFAAQISMQGTGRLNDGRLIRYAGACDCAESPCFEQVNPRAKWGTGARMRALTPFRSVAVDPRVIAIGAWLYVPELDGLKMPGNAPWGNFVHDGCVVAEDTGGAIDGKHIDFFVAGRQHYNRLDRKHRLDRITVFDGTQKCGAHVARGRVASAP